jgi:hypothetical protein
MKYILFVKHKLKTKYTLLFVELTNLFWVFPLIRNKLKGLADYQTERNHLLPKLQIVFYFQ